MLPSRVGKTPRRHADGVTRRLLAHDRRGHGTDGFDNRLHGITGVDAGCAGRSGREEITGMKRRDPRVERDHLAGRKQHVLDAVRGVFATVVTRLDGEGIESQRFIGHGNRVAGHEERICSSSRA